MLSSTTTFIFALALSATVWAAPTIDEDTLRTNGLDAQARNVGFQTLKVDDACNDQELGCISGGVAACIKSKWDVTECPSEEQCFALPSERKPGTVILCKTKAEALSAFEAAGVEGGISGQDAPSTDEPATDDSSTDKGVDEGAEDDACDDDDGTDGQDDCDESDGSTNDTNGEASPEDDSTTDSGVVTVTVTVTPPVTSISASTTILSPEQASSFLSSLTAVSAPASGTATAISTVVTDPASPSSFSESTLPSVTESAVVTSTPVSATDVESVSATISEVASSSASSVVPFTVGPSSSVPVESALPTSDAPPATSTGKVVILLTAARPAPTA